MDGKFFFIYFFKPGGLLKLLQVMHTRMVLHYYLYLLLLLPKYASTRSINDDGTVNVLLLSCNMISFL